MFTIWFLVRAPRWHLLSGTGHIQMRNVSWAQGKDVWGALGHSDLSLSWWSGAGTARSSLKSSPSCFSLGTLRGKSKACVSDSFTMNSSSWCLARVLGCLRKGFWFGFICFLWCFSFEIGSLFLPRVQWNTRFEVGSEHKKKLRFSPLCFPVFNCAKQVIDNV